MIRPRGGMFLSFLFEVNLLPSLGPVNGSDTVDISAFKLRRAHIPIILYRDLSSSGRSRDRRSICRECSRRIREAVLSCMPLLPAGIYKGPPTCPSSRCRCTPLRTLLHPLQQSSHWSGNGVKGLRRSDRGKMGDLTIWSSCGGMKESSPLFVGFGPIMVRL